MHDPNLKGNVAELAIATEAARLGISVLKPLTEHERYDLVFDLSDRLLRVQCKWASRRGEVVVVSCRSSYHSPGRRYVHSAYTAADADVIAAYCSQTASFYAIPVAPFAGQTQIHLRLSPARNGQRAALHFAQDYPFGAVAQLAERLAGSEEARGSNPLSSTPTEATVAETVGAHEFRNLFGWYMQRAAAGERFLVTRRGRPFARLHPP